MTTPWSAGSVAPKTRMKHPQPHYYRNLALTILRQSYPVGGSDGMDMHSVPRLVSNLSQIYCFPPPRERQTYKTWFECVKADLNECGLAGIYTQDSYTWRASVWRVVTPSFDVFFGLRLNKRLSKQSWDWWFETPLRSLWRHSNDCFKFQCGEEWDLVVFGHCRVSYAQYYIQLNYIQRGIYSTLEPTLAKLKSSITSKFGFVSLWNRQEQSHSRAYTLGKFSYRV